MLPRRIGLLRLASHIVHLLCLFVAFAIALYLRFSSGLFAIRDLPHMPAYDAYLLLSAAFWSLFSRYYHVDDLLWQSEEGRLETCPTWPGAVLRATLAALAASSVSAFFYRGYSFSRVMVAMVWLLHLALALASGSLMTRFRRRLAQEKALVRLLIIGEGPFAYRTSERLRASGLLAGIPTFVAPGDPSLPDRLGSGEWEEVVVALPLEEHGALSGLLESLGNLHTPVRVALDLPSGTLHSLGGIPMLDLGVSPSDKLSYALAKRTLDIILSSLMLVAGAPLAVLVAALVKLSSSGPVFFSQMRVGVNGRTFRMYKFRTLPVGSTEKSDRDWRPEPDRVGLLLRRLRIDEWPQFWNVLRGDMSVVGPRPEREHFAQGFQQVLREYGLRHRLKAGITGWAQVHGLTGDSDISKRLQYDLYYLRHWSLGLDLRILLMTALRFAHKEQ